MTPSPPSPKEIDEIKERLRWWHLRGVLGSESAGELMGEAADAIDHLEEQLKTRSPHFTGEADPQRMSNE